MFFLVNTWMKAVPSRNECYCFGDIDPTQWLNWLLGKNLVPFGSMAGFLKLPADIICTHHTTWIKYLYPKNYSIHDCKYCDFLTIITFLFFWKHLEKSLKWNFHIISSTLQVTIASSMFNESVSTTVRHATCTTRAVFFRALSVAHMSWIHGFPVW